MVLDIFVNAKRATRFHAVCYAPGARASSARGHDVAAEIVAVKIGKARGLHVDLIEYVGKAAMTLHYRAVLSAPEPVE